MKNFFLQIAIVLAVLALSVSPSYAALNLVVNGDFMTGDFTGWTLTGDSSEAYVGQDSGEYAAELTTSSDDNLYLSQNITTVIGQTYTFSFSLEGDGASPNSFSASLGGITENSQANVPDDLGSPMVFSSSFTATATTTALSFQVDDAPGYLFVTDVSVSATTVPEPSTSALMLGGVTALAFMFRRTLVSATRS